MDGSNHIILVNGSDIGWPNGLAIDFDGNYVYWVDAKTDTIEKMKLDGSDREIVMSDHRHPFGLALNKDRIFYSDWQEKSIFSVSRKNISDRSILREGLSGLMEVQVFDKSLQKGIYCLNPFLLEI